jgi:hypothetical protein
MISAHLAGENITIDAEDVSGGVFELDDGGSCVTV